MADKRYDFYLKIKPISNEYALHILNYFTAYKYSKYDEKVFLGHCDITYDRKLPTMIHLGLYVEESIYIDLINDITEEIPFVSEIELKLALWTEEMISFVLPIFFGNMKITSLLIFKPSSSRTTYQNCLGVFKLYILNSVVTKIDFNEYGVKSPVEEEIDLFLRDNPVQNRSISLRTKWNIKSASKIT